MAWRFVQGLVLLWLAVCVSGPHSFAQELEQKTDVPLMGSEASPDLPGGLAETPPALAGKELKGAGADGVFRVLVFGDALAGGMGAGISRMAEEQPEIEIVNRFNELSGLARPEFHDWASSLPKITEAKTYDAAILMLGTNDRQVIRSGDNRFEFGSVEWRSFYEAQIDRLLDVLKSEGLRIYWIGLPPMADSQFDADMRIISDLQRSHAEKNGATFIDIRPFFTEKDGTLVERVPDASGTLRRLRESDGVSFMKLGNNRLGQVVLDAVMKAETGVAPDVPVVPAQVAVVEAPAVAVVAPPDEPQAPTPDVAPQVGPLFGQQGSNGEDIAFNADVVVPVKPRPSVAQQQKLPETLAPPTGVKIVAAQGTVAEKLFTTGETGVAPTGRFDDDSFVSQPVTN